MPKLTFGVALDFGAKVRPLHEQLARQTQLAVLAEQAGFEAVAAGEVQALGSFHLPNSLLVLSALAQHTSMRLVTGILLLPAWEPWKLALDTAQLDQLSAGRLTVGIGLGSPAVHALGGWQKESIGQRADETLAALRALWAGEPSFSGEEVRVGHPITVLPAQAGGPPLWVGGTIKRSARRAAQLGDGWYAGVNFRLSRLAPQVQVYREALAQHGKTSGAVVMNRLAIGADNAAAAQELADRYFGATLQGYARDEPVQQVASEVCLVGGPDELIGQAQRYQEAGVTHILARLSLEDMPAEVAAKSIEIIGRHVIPAFRG